MPGLKPSHNSFTLSTWLVRPTTITTAFSRGYTLSPLPRLLPYFKLKFTSTLSVTGTALPSFMPGRNFHSCNANIAFSVSP
jgi:hypothetical protein